MGVRIVSPQSITYTQVRGPKYDPYSYELGTLKMEMKKALAAAALTGALCSAAGGAAIAATQYPAEGGQWNYGYNGADIYSDYQVSRNHGSSVQNDWGYNSSICVASGYWSNASISATPWTHNSYYYRVC